MKSILCVFAAIALSSCRSAKPTSSYASMADSGAITTQSVIIETEDSVLIGEKTKVLVNDSFEFVEGGGSIHVHADGSLSMTGVAAVSTSSMGSFTKQEHSKSQSIKAHSKDSLISAHTTSASHEFKEKASSGKWSRRMIYIVVALIILGILRVILKFRKSLIIN